jgi:hypothetical protein
MGNMNEVRVQARKGTTCRREGVNVRHTTKGKCRSEIAAFIPARDETYGVLVRGADAAYQAGAPARKGRAGDGLLMPVTLTFVLGGVHHRRLYAFKPNIHLTNWPRSRPFCTATPAGERC